MAGDWIAWCKGLARKPEVLAVAKASRKNRREVATILMEFWEWADEQTSDGIIPNAVLADLADIIPGTTEKFWQSVLDTGWLRVTVRGIEIPHFDRWLGQSAKKRLQKNARQAKWRSPGDDDVDAPVDANADAPESTSVDVPVDEARRLKAPTREPESKEPERNGKNRTESEPGAARPPRPRDELFDAVAEVGGADPKLNGSLIGKVAAALRDNDPPYTAAEVRALPAALLAHGLDFTITVPSIPNHIARVRLKPTAKASGTGKRLAFTQLQQFAAGDETDGH